MAQVLGFINHAENFYGTDQSDTGQYSAPSSWLTNIPRMKYMWTVEFELNKPTNPEIMEMIQGNGQVGSITNIAKSVQLPDLAFNTVTLNQYNKKRHVHTHGEWQPIQMVFHDTVSNRLEKILMDYRKYYWVSEDYPGLKHIRDRDQTSSQFASNFGMRAIAEPTDNYFKSITINREWAGKSDQYVLINPKITSFAHDTLDYTSNDTVQWTLTVSYEAVEFRSGKQPARPNGPNLTYLSYSKGQDAGPAEGTGLDNASNTGGNGTPDGQQDGGFSGEDMADLKNWDETGGPPSGTDAMAPYDEFAGVDDAVAKQEAEKNSWGNQLKDKFSSIKENVGGLYQKAQDFSIGGIPVGKAINPQNIGSTIAIGATIATNKNALKNPAFLLGAVNKVASGIPGAGQYLNSGALQTAAVVGTVAAGAKGVKGLGAVAAIAAGYGLLGTTSSQKNTFGEQPGHTGDPVQTPMASFVNNKNDIPGRF